jgi:hypothetical protein
VEKSYPGGDLLGAWRSGVLVWPAGWVLLDRSEFAVLWRDQAGAVMPVRTAAVLLHCPAGRIRAWVRQGSVRAFAFPGGHNWVALADVRSLCNSEV